MADKKIAIYTLGCKVNQYESASLARLFQEQGYRVVEFEEAADVYIINTCTVTHLGDRKSRQLIRRASRTNPAAVIVVTGCYAQTSTEDVLKIPQVNLVIGTKDRTRLVELVEACVQGRRINAVSAYVPGDEFEEISGQPCQERVRAFLKIQDGCDNYCTYCIVPYARGPQRSRRPEKIYDTARKMVDSGFKEIVITGIQTGAYGRDLEKGPALSELLRKLSAIPGLLRLRLSSIEPNDITPDLLDTLAGSSVFCRHLHVPLQSGDDEILHKMGRRYNAWEYYRLVKVLKENITGLGLTTDVIVGFPGESENHFSNTCALVEELSFSGLHVFKFSPRRGTPAADFDGQIEPHVKEERSRKLIQLGRRLGARFASSHLGQQLEVLVEERYQNKSGLYTGLTDNYIRVVFPGDDDLLGQAVKVEATGLKGSLLEGELL